MISRALAFLWSLCRITLRSSFLAHGAIKKDRLQFDPRAASVTVQNVIMMNACHLRYESALHLIIVHQLAFRVCLTLYLLLALLHSKVISFSIVGVLTHTRYWLGIRASNCIWRLKTVLITFIFHFNCLHFIHYVFK